MNCKSDLHIEGNFPAPIPPPPFTPNGDFTLSSFRAKSYLQHIPASQYGYFLLSLLDDAAALQFMFTGVSVNEALDVLWSILDELFNIQELSVIIRERFRKRKQQPSESVDELLRSLRVLLARAFPDYYIDTRNRELLDQFVLGIRERSLLQEFILDPPFFVS
ncbi:unnamed protein product [Dicrocoelium dendriticum]|nr:unnamed protein product [Dicrocoelium dendriticum]